MTGTKAVLTSAAAVLLLRARQTHDLSGRLRATGRLTDAAIALAKAEGFIEAAEFVIGLTKAPA